MSFPAGCEVAHLGIDNIRHLGFGRDDPEVIRQPSPPGPEIAQARSLALGRDPFGATLEGLAEQA